ncbi:hypothetical protein TSOC_002962 [Tetrabaena socialis]|uniref:Uncharacterized protein n=1 Tax=Tetrabaena socialis TaxID=47790 RepID=A0A2J8ACS2_9CHLO|nr:hypothetical protein TSOC_002962 [Tetrabaena socialis]|eukprot:PNH10306.1 hypothetical protein TSOC_002962 [Tetrabaena socialis]
MEDEAAAVAAEAAEAAATPATPAWSNSIAPFGGELAEAMQRRAEQRRVSAVEAAAAPQAPDAAAAATPSAVREAPVQQHSTPYNVGALRRVRRSSSGAEGASGSQQAMAAESLGPSGVVGDAGVPAPHPGGSSPAPSAEPSTPAPGSLLASAVRRSAPSVAAASMVTPGGMSELQEKLLRRRSAVDAQTPSPPQMAEAQ